MAAPKGNKYWKLREKHGIEKKYTPEELHEKANEYFEWCQANPLQEEVAFHYQGVIIKDTISKMRAFTARGLCNYLYIVEKTLWNYERDKDFVQVITRIKQIIDTQKFEGAAAGLLNANIIARDLGLRDGQDHTTKGKEMGNGNTIIKFGKK
jgi:hypothetical protein